MLANLDSTSRSLYFSQSVLKSSFVLRIYILKNNKLTRKRLAVKPTKLNMILVINLHIGQMSKQIVGSCI